MEKINKVERVSYSGGILGLLFGSARGKLEAVVQRANSDGWNVAEIVEDNPNLAIVILRLLLLVLTLGLWTLGASRLIIFEKTR
ncbi:hypothetical protein [Tateyamaria sp.]|uniref:hypothetical protein n=1 Tax=Tateyamaria sp. TaxID=1929288 RepID=UPI00329AF79E